MCVTGAQGGQNRALDPQNLEVYLVTGYEPPCGSWELNWWPLQEQQVLRTSESPLQPQGMESLDTSEAYPEKQGLIPHYKLTPVIWGSRTYSKHKLEKTKQNQDSKFRGLTL